MTPLLSIRPLRPSDESLFLERILHTTWQEIPAAEQQGRTPDDLRPRVERVVEILLEQGDNVRLVADLPAAPHVGQIWLGEARDPYTGARRGYIYDLYVAEAWRGQGIGRALLAAAEAAGRRRGDQEIALAVAAENAPARALYDAHGFHVERLILTKPLEEPSC